MKKCPYCHEDVSSDAHFCNHCGKNMDEYENEQEQVEALSSKEQADSKEETPTENTDQNLETEDPVSPVPVEGKQELVETEDHTELVPEEQEGTVTPVASPTKPKGNGKNKWYIGIVAIIAILGIGFYALGKSLTSENNIINNFEQAVEDGDTKELKGLLESDDKNMKVTDEGLKGFIALYESKPSELKQVVQNLKREAKGDRTPYQMFPVSIHKDGKKWLIFDNYKIVVSPVFFNVSTNYENTTIYVGDEEVAVSDADYFETEVGPFMPGEYTIKGVHDTGFSHLDVEETIVHSDPELSKYVDLHIDGSTVYFTFEEYKYNDLKSIKLYINGKETDHDLIKDNFVGPLLTDGSMNASFEAEFPWGAVLTKEVPIDSTDISVNFAQNDEFQEEIVDIVMEFNTELPKFYAELNIDDLTTVSVSFLELLIDEVAPNIDSGLEYKGAFHGAEFYLDSFNLSKNYNDIWFVEVDGISYFEEAIYEEGEEEEELEKIEEETRFVLGYDQTSKEWVLSGLDYASWMDEDDMERFTIEEPEIFTSKWNDDKEKKKDKDKDKD